MGEESAAATAAARATGSIGSETSSPTLTSVLPFVAQSGSAAAGVGSVVSQGVEIAVARATAAKVLGSIE